MLFEIGCLAAAIFMLYLLGTNAQKQAEINDLERKLDDLEFELHMMEYEHFREIDDLQWKNVAIHNQLWLEKGERESEQRMNEWHSLN